MQFFSCVRGKSPRVFGLTGRLHGRRVIAMKPPIPILDPQAPDGQELFPSPAA
jgi:hypothetical protein